MLKRPGLTALFAGVFVTIAFAADAAAADLDTDGNGDYQPPVSFTLASGSAGATTVETTTRSDREYSGEEPSSRSVSSSTTHHRATDPTRRYLAQFGAGLLGLFGGSVVGGALGFGTMVAIGAATPGIDWHPDTWEPGFFMLGALTIVTLASIGALGGTTWAVYRTGHAYGGDGSALATFGGAFVGTVIGAPLGPFGPPAGAVLGYELSSSPPEPRVATPTGAASLRPHVSLVEEHNPDDGNRLTLGLRGRF